MNILPFNLVLNTFVCGVAAGIYVMPRLRQLSPQAVLLPILLLHSTRHLGLMFLDLGATYAGLPWQFAQPAAWGDLVAAVLAMSSLAAIICRARGARLLVWVFNLEGTIDLLAAIVLANIYGATQMGPAYWIPACWVPALLVTHYITFVVLLKYWRDAALAPSEAVRGSQV